MANSKKNLREHHDECIDDTASEGDTSDEECVESSSTKKLSVTRRRKEGLEVPYGSDYTETRTKKRRCICITLVVLAIVVVGASVGGGIYAFQRNQTMDLSPPVSEEDAMYAVNGESKNTEETPIDDQKVAEEDTTLLDALISNLEKIEPMEELVDFEATEEDESSKEDDSTPTRWPELVGMSGEAAKAELEVLYGEGTYDIVIMHYNYPTTRDYRFDRIRIFTDDDGIVVSVPYIG